MALSSCPVPVEIENSALEGWKVIGSGGFGQIYKARHRKWCCDVAIKLLHHDDGTSSSLLREVDMMRQGSSPHVIHVHGVFRGRLPDAGSSVQLGLVMEFMERGSLSSLQETLQVPPPWPLVSRMIHQVALGINFLHNLSPPLLHLDLKPSNVLLDLSLNAKLTDFGLARFYHSVTRGSRKDSDEAGTINYMPPEAFTISYSPSQASDIYSYGILLWSIITGKQPYPNAMSSIVRIRIPEGDRPSLDEIRCQEAGRAGLAGLIELMKRCWETRPRQRPSSFECTALTEELYKMHKHTINDAVHEALKELDQKQEAGMSRNDTTLVTSRVYALNIHDNVPTGRPPVQEMAGHWIANERVEAKDSYPGQPPSACKAVPACSSKDCQEKTSSVHPIQPSPPPLSTRMMPQNKAPKCSQQKFKELSPQYQRQFSSPESLLCNPQRRINMHFVNVNGFQFGNNNTMYIQSPDPSERKRHPTAPSTINLPLH
ncbi:receptor-interacting serine/threonine-protein kinase 3 [Cololabis saira]|uniref:receptor-interacting serine/threonine-protein kinase 3 n=1 Tax=Cololabis saira TaxID=129043 RepID=UPI002AD499D0|nr:receptor-interacting serine/threonine-protein kinase 3 [Cololabis saira]